MTGSREFATEPLAVPASLVRSVVGYQWGRDMVGEAGAAVRRLHAPGAPDLYLKHGAGDVADDVVDEMVRMRWLAARLDVPAIQGFVLDDAGAWLLMTAIPGRTAYQLLTERPDARAAVVDALAAHLRTLHAIPPASCPFDSGYRVRMKQARKRIDLGLVDVDDFGEAHAGWTAEQVWAELVGLLPFEQDLVVTHGDYSLDNILISDGLVVGCIDLGRVGVADRYQDLAILCECLDEFDGPWRARFLDGYGVPAPDERKMRFHLSLDELF